jgi:hypothetical protein
MLALDPWSPGISALSSLRRPTPHVLGIVVDSMRHRCHGMVNAGRTASRTGEHRQAAPPSTARLCRWARSAANTRRWARGEAWASVARRRSTPSDRTHCRPKPAVECVGTNHHKVVTVPEFHLPYHLYRVWQRHSSRRSGSGESVSQARTCVLSRTRVVRPAIVFEVILLAAEFLGDQQLG